MRVTKRSCGKQRSTIFSFAYSILSILNLITLALWKVAVLFADIVDFTKFSTKLSAEELVAFLNEVFSSFDRLADRYGLEKIKTIGDAYIPSSC